MRKQVPARPVLLCLRRRRRREAPQASDPALQEGPQGPADCRVDRAVLGAFATIDSTSAQFCSEFFASFETNARGHP
jgi:hypothetical protein